MKGNNQFSTLKNEKNENFSCQILGSVSLVLGEQVALDGDEIERKCPKLRCHYTRGIFLYSSQNGVVGFKSSRASSSFEVHNVILS